MGRIIAMVVLALLGASGCNIIINNFNTSPDGSVSTPDASVSDAGPRCGYTVRNQTPGIPGIALVGQEFVAAMPGGLSDTCTTRTDAVTATVEIFDPAGATVSGRLDVIDIGRDGSGARRFDTETTFTPTSAGLWTLVVSWPNGVPQTAKLAVAQPVAPAATVERRTYIDRLDTCVNGGPYATSNGLVLCGRADDEVWVYDTSGRILTHFTGRGLAVSGNDVWTLVGAQVEHRTDVGGSLRFDGSVPAQLLVGRGQIERGLFQKQVTGGVLTVTFDGGVLSSSFHQTPVSADTLIFVVDDGISWSQSGCSERPGCAQTDCGTVSACIPSRSFFHAIDDDAVWGVYPVGSDQLTVATLLTMRKRPLGNDVQELVLYQRVPPNRTWDRYDPSLGGWPNGTAQPPPDKAVLLTPTHFVFPALGPNGITFRAVEGNSARIMSATNDWVIELEDPFTAILTKLR